MIKHFSLICIILFCSAANIFGANEVSINTQVTTAVTLSTNTDYRISSATPFTSTGSINITNTDNAVVIFDVIKPSEAAAQLGFIKINGADAVNGTNCMVRIYKHGSIILPHGSSFQPLTVYSGENYTGTAYSSFNVKTGYNLTDASLNNKIRSLKLKRGYMAFVSTKKNGYGYNREFIAANEDLVVPIAQIELYDKISYIKILQWNDVNKKGYAGNDNTANALLNTNWCYNWDAGTNSWADREYVTIHQQKYWPSISDVGNNGTSPNALGNNEPDNSDQQIASVDEVLSSWPEMMATGKRLGSPSALKTAWLYQFLDSIDARGWRCDFVTVHAYWYSDAAAWKSTLDAIHTRTNRPIWITEMNYGANWTGWPGTDTNASAANYAIEKQHMAPIIAQLDALTYVERYAYYNWVQDCRKAYNADDATLASTNYLTPMGEYYADDKPYLAYKNGNGNEFVPTSPRYNAPSGLKSYFDSTTGACTLTWKDLNGEFTKSITVERKYGNGSYEAIGTVPVSTDEANTSYSYTDNISKADNYTYRIHTINYKDENYYTNGTENFGGMTVNASDVALPKGDYTLSVKGTVSTAITVNGGKYTYTPTTTCNVRFVKKDGTVYVYEGNKYMGTVSETTPTVAATLPDIFTTFDNSNTTKSNATAKTGIYDYRNMIKNPGFETPGWDVEGGHTAPYWSCTGAGTATSWGCREYASTVCEGANAYMIHYTPKETACLSQNIGPLESNTEYQIQLNSWAYASGKNEWLTIGVGTTAGGTDIATKGISVGGSNTSAATWTFNFTTGTMTDKDVYFSLTRIAKTGDDQKNIGLVDRIVIVKAAVQGVTGTEGTTAELLEGTAVPPVLENELSETTDYTATAATDAGVTLNRTLKGNMWNTICLPFGLTSDQMHFAFGNDVKVAEFSEVSGTVFNFTTVAQTSANIPYLIFPTSAGTKYTFNKVTIESSSNELTKTTGGVDFVGTYKSETVPSDAFFISNNVFYKSNGSSPIKGFRAYFKSPSNAKEMNISVDGTTTGINGTISDKKEESVNVYDINGIIINNNSVSLKSLPKGVYIIKGKKVSVNHK